jgi:hypothetical protein
LIERVIAAHPAETKPRRQPTPQELDGLRRGNERRRLEALARKEAKVHERKKETSARA